MPGMIVSSDLFFASKLVGVGQDHGCRIDQAPTPERALERCRGEQYDLVLIDLETPKLAIEECVAALRALPNPPVIYAYGPHVQGERLQAAQAAGCDQVFTRGQLSGHAWPVLAGQLSEAAGPELGQPEGAAE